MTCELERWLGGGRWLVVDTINWSQSDVAVLVHVTVVFKCLRLCIPGCSGRKLLHIAIHDCV